MKLINTMRVDFGRGEPTGPRFFRSVARWQGLSALALLCVNLSAHAQSVDAFNPNANGTVRSMTVLTNGRIVIGGTFTSIGATTRNRIAQLNADGTLVNTFNPNANERILAAVVQADGKIVIGGGFTMVGGQSRTHLARLNSDGSLDTGFTTVANNWVWAVAPQADGKILVGGLFTTLGGQTRNYIARLNANGSLDTFNPGADAQVNSIVEQPDGRIVVGGFFTNLAGQVHQRIGRLNAIGTIDSTFNPGTDGTVWKLALQSNGQIIVSGSFNTVAGQPRTNLARLNSSGSIDSGFNPGASSTVNSLVVQADGKIVAGGNFTTLAGQGRTYIGRLNTNGTLDTGFTAVANNTLYNLALQADGKILVGGDFTTLGGQPRNRMGRLSSASIAITTQPQSQKVLFGSPATFTVAVTGAAPIFYQWRKDGAVISGATNASFTIPSVQSTSGGSYSVIVSNAGGSVTSSSATLNGLKILNDDFDTAFVISGLPASVAGHNVGATSEVGEPEHSSFSAGKTVWWQWTAPFNAAVTLDSFGSSFNTVLAVYTGNTVSTLSGVASNAFGETASFQATAGTTYRIAVDGSSGNNESGSIVLNLRPPPGNDAFANSFVITGMVNFVVGHNIGATAQPGEPSHYDPAPGGGSPATSTVWWHWTAPSNTMVSLDTTGSSFSTVLAVYTGSSVTALSLVSSNHYQRFGGQGGRSRLSFPATAGQTYRIVVDGDFGENGLIVLQLRAGAAAGNDAFANRYVIPQGTSSVSGSNVDASKENGEPDHAGQEGGRSIWWTWTSPTNGTVTLDTAGSSVAPDLAIYTGNAVSGLTEVASNNGFPESRVTFNVVAGTTYQIALDSIDSGALVLNFRSAPSNDAFANAAELNGTSVSVTGNNRGATKQSGEGNHAGDTGGRSVWWRWTAPSSGPFVLDTIGSSFDTLLAIYTGSSVSGLALIASDDEGGDGSTSKVFFTAVSGTTYRIVVDAKAAVGGDIQLNLHPAPASPSNDAFANARNIPSLPATINGWNLGATTEVNEPPFEATASVWWKFTAPGNGTVTIDKLSGVPSLRFTVFQGTSVSTLTEIAASTDFNSFPFRIDCTVGFAVQSGGIYYIAVDSNPGGESYFDFGVAFAPTPINDAFANRIQFSNVPASLFGSTVGATTEAGEPAEATSGSIWWSWTPTSSGPMILTTAGSSFDTVLAVYTGATLGALSLVACNDDAFTLPIVTAPPSDPISRVKFTAAAGTSYHIMVAAARGGPGGVTLNFEPLAIEEIVSMTPSPQPDRTTDFAASLRLANFRAAPSGPLRVRLLARAGYSYIQLLANNCGRNLPAQDVPDQELAIIDLPVPATLGAGASVPITVNGRCPAPLESGSWGYGWGVFAILEEEAGGIWTVQDSRLLLVGGWPRVGGFIGPGGGVVTIKSGTGAVGPAPGLVRVQLGPPSALRLGGQWRVSPTNFGNIALRPYTNYTSSTITLTAPTNGFTLEVKELPGFITPVNQTLTIVPGATVPLNLNYSVVPPRLLFHRTLGLGMTGTTATAYQIDRVSSLFPPINWASNTAVTLIPGTNWIPGTAPITTTNTFYRARWLPD